MKVEPKQKRTDPVDTKQLGYSILIPTNKNPSVPSVYKVYFGKKYLIWKGKSLLQSCEILAKSISANLSKISKGDSIEDTNYLYHVMKHIKSTRCYSAYVDNDSIINDFGNDKVDLDVLLLLKTEQRLLDEAEGDPLCLNNNIQAYLPVNNIWIFEPIKKQFLKWYKERRK